ncbi:Deleted in malignant brain tumors 1 protein [Holothuria leucospilota]|uniref:Deleted in malignant brain tumors 1 protein n=1 Tax=Holothuria leucospilota TaxID=206669 RepID=A0A9Q1HGZ3_HOLLE|nr:Deleted in malignant brain tumors 1 protein [Holothuria leucospilota]
MQGIRLTDGANGTFSRVDILYDDQWGTVCGDEEWDLVDARVVCHQLGFHNATKSYKNASIQGSQFYSMNNVQCHGNETSISSCRHERFQRGNCPVEAGVSCQENALINSLMLRVNTGDGLQGIRLADGLSNSSGRVEVLIDGEWGAVCEDYYGDWNLVDARVVCRQLGYNTAIAAPKQAFFGEGYGPVLIKDVQCTGKEASLSSCRQDATVYCQHHYVVGVACGGKDRSLEAKSKQGLTFFVCHDY